MFDLSVSESKLSKLSSCSSWPFSFGFNGSISSSRTVGWKLLCICSWWFIIGRYKVLCWHGSPVLSSSAPWNLRSVHVQVKISCLSLQFTSKSDHVIMPTIARTLLHNIDKYIKKIKKMTFDWLLSLNNTNIIIYYQY